MQLDSCDYVFAPDKQSSKWFLKWWLISNNSEVTQYRIWQTHEDVFDYQKRFGIITGFRLLEPEGNLNKQRETFELFNSYSKYLSVCYQRKQLYCAFSSLYNTTGVNTNEINIIWNKLEWYAERDVVDVERINKVKYVLNKTAKLPCKLQTVTIK